MSNLRKIIISFLGTLVLWAFFSWPLPHYLFTGIPALAHPSEVDVQVVSAGDHLQFFYHCRLVEDMLSGHVPWFHNLYEFNTGDDAERFRVEPYYMPFSLLYALSARVGGSPFGWNLTGFISLWLTFLFTWLLTARYVSSDFISGMTAAVSIALPYRWICLLGGSPTGFAMMWAPVIWFGVDIAVRDGKVRGGLIAGLGILFSAWTDMHVFFFSVLAVPGWCLLAFIARDKRDESRSVVIKNLVLALLPVLVFSVVAALLPRLMEWITSVRTGLSPEADAVSKRTLREVLIYSPGWQGLFTWHELRKWGEIYVGFAVLAVILFGGTLLVWRSVRHWREKRRSLLIFLLLISGLFFVVFLALGARGPWDGAAIKACRALIPPYGMIRQPIKIFCLVPSFLVMALAISLSEIVRDISKRSVRLGIVVLSVFIISLEYGIRVFPHICLLEEQQGAYAAVAERALDEQRVPRALVIPLWPGDSHYASVYQYFASMYRVRMINGYTPFVKSGYFEDVFKRFESVNQGDLSDEQIEALLNMDVRAIIVHEDLFPEKVSPFPITFTLKQFLNHPRLALLRQDGCVWSFEILPERVEREASAHWNVFGAGRVWEAQWCETDNAVIVDERSAGGGGYVKLVRKGSMLFVPGCNVAGTSNLKWMIRARGDGFVSVDLLRDDFRFDQHEVSLETSEWVWLTIPVEGHDSFAPLALSIELRAGVIDVDTVLLLTGNWNPPAPGQVLRIPAPAFFHAGYINRERDSVVFRKDGHANVFVFYGPKLPLDKGRYEVELVFKTDAPDGVELGWFNVRRHAHDPEQQNEVRAGKRAFTILEHDDNTVVNVEFVFLRNADIEIDEVLFRRLP